MRLLEAVQEEIPQEESVKHMEAAEKILEEVERKKKQGNVVHCGPAVFVCFENKHLAVSITLMALSVTMDFAPCSNALRFTALCVHFVLFPMGFTSPCANQRKKKRLEASNMLGSCCIHDRPDIDTYLAYLDMYTDSYIHICKYIYIYLYIHMVHIYIYVCV